MNPIVAKGVNLEKFNFRGWWHGDCYGGCRLNGKYYMPSWTDGFAWYTGGGDNYDWWLNPYRSEMKLRRN